MREIKFRAWDKAERQMYGWGNLFFSDQSPVTGYGSDFPDDKGDIVLLQFTGFHDKNGKEIYEGDILQDHNWKVTRFVEFRGCAYYGAIADHPERSRFLTDVADTHAVIGNIYENPELLVAK